VTQANKHLAVTQNFRNTVGYKPILFCDVETLDGTSIDTRTARVIDFLNALKAAGVQRGIYSSPGFWNGNINHNMIAPILADTVSPVWLWVAHWTSAALPLKPTGWTDARLKFWQKGISGQHAWCPPPPPGFAGTVDYNTFFGTLADLQSLLQVPQSMPPIDEAVTILWREAGLRGWNLNP
jgi:GH25 family lysozyme M1 (1,4-beta-N-acetylmuramidase)